jgi:hypothetical protein
VGACEHDSEPLGSIKGWEFLGQLMLEQLGFSRRTLFHGLRYLRYVEDGQKNRSGTFSSVQWLNFVFIANSIRIRMKSW